MKIRHLIFSLLPALAVAEEGTTVPDDEPLLPPLPEELLFPQKGKAALPATALPVISYRAPEDEEQTWLRLLYVKETETWPEIFRRMAKASHEKDMEMCHGYSLWLKGQELIHLRYDDDLSLSGIHADGHAYGVLFVEFSPYGVRVCPMQGYDLTGKNGGVCWQDAPTKLWSWADSAQFWSELPKLLKADTKTQATSAHDSAVKRDVATKGQRMVVFWAPSGYPASAWWAAFSHLHSVVGANRFSLVALEGLNLRNDVVVPTVAPVTRPKKAAPATTNTPSAAPSPTPAPATSAAAPTASAPSESTAATSAPGGSPVATPSAPTPITAAMPLHATGAHMTPLPAAEAALSTPTPETPTTELPPATVAPVPTAAATKTTATKTTPAPPAPPAPPVVAAPAPATAPAAAATPAPAPPVAAAPTAAAPAAAPVAPAESKPASGGGRLDSVHNIGIP